MNTQINQQTAEHVNNMDGVLESFLGWLEEHHQQEASDVGESKGFLSMGIKNEYAQQLEEFLKNPIDHLYTTKNGIDETLMKTINTMVSAFIKSKSEIVSSVLLCSTKSCNLYYCISLKEDTLENRIEISDFLDFYDDYNLSSSYKVYFQFVAEKFLPTIKFEQKIV